MNSFSTSHGPRFGPGQSPWRRQRGAKGAVATPRQTAPLSPRPPPSKRGDRWFVNKRENNRDQSKNKIESNYQNIKKGDVLPRIP